MDLHMTHVPPCYNTYPSHDSSGALDLSVKSNACNYLGTSSISTSNPHPDSTLHYHKASVAYACQDENCQLFSNSRQCGNQSDCSIQQGARFTKERHLCPQVDIAYEGNFSQNYYYHQIAHPGNTASQRVGYLNRNEEAMVQDEKEIVGTHHYQRCHPQWPTQSHYDSYTTSHLDSHQLLHERPAFLDRGSKSQRTCHAIVESTIDSGVHLGAPIYPHDTSHTYLPEQWAMSNGHPNMALVGQSPQSSEQNLQEDVSMSLTGQSLTCQDIIDRALRAEIYRTSENRPQQAHETAPGSLIQSTHGGAMSTFSPCMSTHTSQNITRTQSHERRSGASYSPGCHIGNVSPLLAYVPGSRDTSPDMSITTITYTPGSYTAGRSGKTMAADIIPPMPKELAILAEVDNPPQTPVISLRGCPQSTSPTAGDVPSPSLPALPTARSPVGAYITSEVAVPIADSTSAPLMSNANTKRPGSDTAAPAGETAQYSPGRAEDGSVERPDTGFCPGETVDGSVDCPAPAYCQGRTPEVGWPIAHSLSTPQISNTNTDRPSSDKAAPMCGISQYRAEDASVDRPAPGYSPGRIADTSVNRPIPVYSPQGAGDGSLGRIGPAYGQRRMADGRVDRRGPVYGPGRTGDGSGDCPIPGYRTGTKVDDSEDHLARANGRENIAHGRGDHPPPEYNPKRTGDGRGDHPPPEYSSGRTVDGSLDCQAPVYTPGGTVDGSLDRQAPVYSPGRTAEPTIDRPAPAYSRGSIAHGKVNHPAPGHCTERIEDGRGDRPAPGYNPERTADGSVDSPPPVYSPGRTPDGSLELAAPVYCPGSNVAPSVDRPDVVCSLDRTADTRAASPASPALSGDCAAPYIPVPRFFEAAAPVPTEPLVLSTPGCPHIVTSGATSAGSSSAPIVATPDAGLVDVEDPPRRPVRPVDRPPMTTWLQEQLRRKEIPGLEWLDEEQLTFKVPWKHGQRHEWTVKRDAEIFVKWAKFTGRLRNDVGRMKSNFSMAIKSVKTLRLLRNLSETKGRNAYRVYQFIPSGPTEATKTHQELVVKMQRQRASLSQ